MVELQPSSIKLRGFRPTVADRPSVGVGRCRLGVGFRLTVAVQLRCGGDRSRVTAEFRHRIRRTIKFAERPDTSARQRGDARLSGQSLAREARNCEGSFQDESAEQRNDLTDNVVCRRVLQSNSCALSRSLICSLSPYPTCCIRPSAIEPWADFIVDTSGSHGKPASGGNIMRAHYLSLVMVWALLALALVSRAHASDEHDCNAVTVISLHHCVQHAVEMGHISNAGVANSLLRQDRCRPRRRGSGQYECGREDPGGVHQRGRSPGWDSYRLDARRSHDRPRD